MIHTCMCMYVCIYNIHTHSRDYPDKIVFAGGDWAFVAASHLVDLLLKYAFDMHTQKQNIIFGYGSCDMEVAFLLMLVDVSLMLIAV